MQKISSFIVKHNKLILIIAIILLIPSCFLLNLYCKLVSFLVMLVYRKIKLKSYI